MIANVLQARPTVDEPDIDLEQRKRLAASLTGMLADAYVLLVKTQGVHWNVVGPLFVSLHQLTEEQYQDLFGAIDEIAERIRALGYLAPTSIAEMMPHSAIGEETGNPTAEQMVEALIRDHETVARRLREAVEMAEGLRDVATADLLTERLQVHEKAVWMLRATIARA
jgi:starvation-inducible DNA-binding protein